jgi:predicted acyltransferase
MSKKTAEDLKQDSVDAIYGAITFAKYVFIFFLICVGCFFFTMFS